MYTCHLRAKRLSRLFFFYHPSLLENMKRIRNFWAVTLRWISSTLQRLPAAYFLWGAVNRSWPTESESLFWESLLRSTNDLVDLWDLWESQLLINCWCIFMCPSVLIHTFKTQHIAYRENKQNNFLPLYLFLLNRLHKVFRNRISLDLFINFLTSGDALVVCLSHQQKKTDTQNQATFVCLSSTCKWCRLVFCYQPRCSEWQVTAACGALDDEPNSFFYVSQQPDGRHAVKAVGSLVTLQTLHSLNTWHSQCKHFTDILYAGLGKTDLRTVIPQPLRTEPNLFRNWMFSHLSHLKNHRGRKWKWTLTH